MKTALAALALTTALALAGCGGAQSGDSNPDNIQDRVPLPTPTASP